MQAWHCWYHCMCSTYGVWLRGDPRGWRTRHHREHVNGDYKHPPRPGTWEHTYERSLRLMKRQPITLSLDDRQLVIAKVIEALHHHHITVLAAALGAEHLHLLAQFNAGTPRKWIGIAKQRAARHLSDLSRYPQGGIWGKRSECKPITDRTHQLATYRYILAHAAEGATIWDFKQAPSDDTDSA